MTDTAPRSDDADAVDEESAYDLLQRGRALMRGRHHAQAAVVLERATRLEPGKGSIIEALGRAHFISGQLERALEVFGELLVLDPSSPYGHYAVGRCLARLGRIDEARINLRLAVALDPSSAMYASALSRVGPPPPRG
ncbi:MAG TPA: tetratricopeptide repeat protein [Candidatus Limnocylindrales bacterium]|nr:tetratricopeptide repeat protein [Candidatus Limnocylindrales bacterium]